MVGGVNGLNMHILEAGFEAPGRPLVLLLHGFPELSFSWRKLLVPLANAGYHVVAPDQRGYGRTTGADTSYDGDLFSYRRLNAVRDAMGLVSALGYSTVAMVVGHDFGSPVAAWCAVTRPDIFKTVVMMSAPFGGTSPFPFSSPEAADRRGGPSMDEDLAALTPSRKHYQRFYQTREANEDMWHAPQGIHAFLRGYYHYKSADWAGNKPHRLTDGSAAAMAVMPTYYVMRREQGMAETVAEVMPSEAEIAANQWLTETEMAVYSEEYGRTSFQGGLQWYRAGNQGVSDMEIFAGRKIEQPSMFISGASDWGTYQGFGSLERMQDTACTNFQGVHLLPGAGHWVQQEQAEKVSELLLEFIGRNGS
jgi:pimeloyl-ACP methyl ester carboxylesterase